MGSTPTTSTSCMDVPSCIDGVHVMSRGVPPCTPSIGKAVSELETPCFLVDLEKATKNCKSMKDSCNKLNLTFRPCTYTHRTLEGAKLQTIEKRGIMCRSLDEVEHLANNGFEDILYGFPLMKANMPRVSKLAEKLTSLHLVVDNWQAVNALKETAPPSGKTWSVILMVDCGAKRQSPEKGVWWELEYGAVLVRIMRDCKHITFKGVYAFCDDAYEGTETNLEKTRDETIERFMKFVARLTAIDVKCNTIGLGGTSICIAPGPNMKKLTELHSANYIFNGSFPQVLNHAELWKRENSACSIATRILCHYPQVNKMSIDCGQNGLSILGNSGRNNKEMSIDCGQNGLLSLGNSGRNNKDMEYALVKDDPNLRVSSVYLGLGMVKSVSGDLDYSKYPIGTIIQLLPWHSCETSLLYKKYHVIDTNGIVTQEWSPCNKPQMLPNYDNCGGYY